MHSCSILRYCHVETRIVTDTCTSKTASSSSVSELFQAGLARFRSQTFRTSISSSHPVKGQRYVRRAPAGLGFIVRARVSDHSIFIF